MPPKLKRGRPPGSKNKKTINLLAQKIKDEQNGENIKQQNDDCYCESCKQSFPSARVYRKHVKSCTIKQEISLAGVDVTPIKPAYNCKQCSKKFRFIKSYESHLLNEHSSTPGSVSCNQCDVVCPNEDVLAQHVQNVHLREIFECEHCDQKFVRRSHVLRHMMQKGCDGRKIVTYPCEICEASFSRKDNLMVHLRLQHITTKHFSCKLCEYHTRNFSKLIIHNQQKHTETPRFECDHCGKITGSRGAIAKHLEIHGDKKFGCEVCGYATFTVEVMRRHVLTHVREKPYKCDICGQSYIQKVQLQRHLEKHTGNQCNICSKSFDSKIKLIVHEIMHKGEPLLCPYSNCDTKKFKDANDLASHIKMHLNEKPFECEVCNKRFNLEVNMRRHMGTHTLEKARRCMYCVSARAYVRGEQLVRHVRKTHPQVFQQRLLHVRSVLGSNLGLSRVRKSEIESILNVLDAESDRILEGCGDGALYGGLQENDDSNIKQEEEKPLMAEDELADSLNKLLTHMIDKEMLECLGWPDEPIDEVLERMISNCGAKAADHSWPRVQRLRENAKQLFLHVVEDQTVARMLHTHTIDQVIKHILAQVADDVQK
ncbi:unnamed protein product [Danaus chrysippus]|uniref:(African queen) hypothetical protein n=1 Tax=Danaus chrysippus TaxID=151541 RepID=A0A8J2QSY5_9NEOP|nr:unnamed protein product [Danaus chrysippus]